MGSDRKVARMPSPFQASGVWPSRSWIIRFQPCSFAYRAMPLTRSALIGLIIAKTLRGFIGRILRNAVGNDKCNSSVKLCNVRQWVVLCIIHPYAYISSDIGSVVRPCVGRRLRGWNARKGSGGGAVHQPCSSWRRQVGATGQHA